jgi:O-antigen/teichoic acid export membrane protein
VYWGDETGLIVVLITSGVVHLAGVVVYLGFYEALAGFSTASDEEMEQFNTDEVTAFMGVSLSLVSMVLFYAFLLAVKFAGNLAGTLSMAAITFVAVVAMSIYVGISQRFKNSKEHASRK